MERDASAEWQAIELRFPTITFRSSPGQSGGNVKLTKLWPIRVQECFQLYLHCPLERASCRHAILCALRRKFVRNVVPWRLRQRIASKCKWTSIRPHGVTWQKAASFTVTEVIIWDINVTLSTAKQQFTWVENMAPSSRYERVVADLEPKTAFANWNSSLIFSASCVYRQTGRKYMASFHASSNSCSPSNRAACKLSYC